MIPVPDGALNRLWGGATDGATVVLPVAADLVEGLVSEIAGLRAAVDAAIAVLDGKDNTPDRRAVLLQDLRAVRGVGPTPEPLTLLRHLAGIQARNETRRP